jgi:hypothetical protein
MSYGDGKSKCSMRVLIMRHSLVVCTFYLTFLASFQGAKDTRQPEISGAGHLWEVEKAGWQFQQMVKEKLKMKSRTGPGRITQ